MTMATKARTTLPALNGEPVNVYAQLSDDRQTVHVWTKAQQIGGYRIERFPGSRLTGATLKAVLTGGA